MRYVIKNYSLYSELSLGADYSKDNGENHSIRGKYRKEATDSRLNLNLNANLFKDDMMTRITWFNRMQVEAIFKKNIYSKEQKSWDGIPVDGPLWNNGYFDFIFRQSVLSLPGGKNFYISPKMTLGYEHQYGDSKDFLSLGVGLGFHQRNQDDWLKLEGSYKKDLGTNRGLFVLSLSLNFAMIKL